ASTPLPAIAEFGIGGPTRLLPVYGGGLRWLDPASGVMSGDAFTAPRSGLFLDAGGAAICVCVEQPWADDRLVTRVTLRRYAASGQEVARTTLYELESTLRGGFGDAIDVQAAIAPDGSHLWISHAVRQADRWDLGVDRIDVASMAVDVSLSLPPIQIPSGSGDSTLVTPDGWITHEKTVVRAGVRVSPDAARISVVLGAQGDPRAAAATPAFQAARYDIDSTLAPGSAIEVTTPPHDASDDPCDLELSAWATNRHFITICSRPDGSGTQPYVRIERAGDIVREVTVGPPVGARDTEWLLDAGEGALYRWSTLAHVFSRLDVADRTMSTLALDWSQAGTGDVGTWPQRDDAQVSFGTLAGFDLVLRPPRMARSPDGSLVYALGYRGVADDLRDDRIASTGIWVLDARRAELVAHWAPDALYDEIGFTPGAERLVTIALAGVDANGVAADWSSSMRFHDPRTGTVDEVLGDVVDSSGFVPSLLVPNAPRGIAGF
ncbi:MAG: hypothetical protein ABIV26_09560, partial [Candidatus Limnocylindrales bacterium]